MNYLYSSIHGVSSYASSVCPEWLIYLEEWLIYLTEFHLASRSQVEWSSLLSINHPCILSLDPLLNTQIWKFLTFPFLLTKQLL